MKNVVHVVLVAMTVAAVQAATIVLRPVVRLVVLQVAMLPLRMAATSQPKLQVLLHRNLPFSAYVKLPRLPLPMRLTVKENKYVATSAS
jgi:hypothetical protein